MMSKKTVSQYIYKRLKEGNYKQADLARHMRISTQLLNWKMTRDVWRVTDLTKVADFFKMRLYELIVESGVK